ncbi:NAD(P)H-dependent flavin oxidoreductase [Meiothermus hypogaeus]|uniref:Propionate 3-nitronate monooxygenase n=2 Tax=Meiothermus hypogaeus TaxID=884155 RepID=A0A511R613_9DEIN|nr:nitronate monooxygenase [Meiothermus hypogaeus]RIH74534.1 putative monooxygenase [Meiothermus hypogaeus]GEM85034.1 oxidoreductase [Meiothermus hypogaeus NBRC 106114]GIW36655.1 MAG: oxidoreductase [Meiothermus sp.]
MAFDLTPHPIVQAPMAGGATTPELVAAVSNVGGLGSLAGVMLSPERLREEIRTIRTLTDRPFNVNLFVLKPVEVSQAELQTALERLQPIRAELGLPPGKPPAKFSEDFEGQLEVLIEEKPPVVSFHFDLLSAPQVERLHQAGCKVIGTATNVAEALAWQEAGADYICAQGAEAGGHRGTFIGPFEHAMTGILALVPQVVEAVKVPVIAAGGIMDGRGIAAALLLGASAVQMGTAFLTCLEAGIHPLYKQALLQTQGDPTVVTRTFSGRPARGLRNAFIERMHSYEALVPPYPIQNALTAEIRQAAAKAGRAEFMSLWAGQAASLCRQLPAAELVQTLVQETQEALRKLQGARHE